MNSNNVVKTKPILFLVIIVFIILLVGTFAWLSYASNKTAMVLTVGDINNVQVTLSPYQINATITPQTAYSSGTYSNVTAVNASSIEKSFRLFYKINTIDSELAISDFKYTIERSTNNGSTYSTYQNGNFSGTTNGGELTILEERIPGNNTTYKYKVYIWLDGNNVGQDYVQGKSFNGELNAQVGSNQYQRVEYLQSSGEQYILTGLTANTGYQVELDGNYTSFVNNRPALGAWVSGYSYLIITGSSNGQKFNLEAGNDNATYYSQVAFDTNRHLFSIRNDGTYLDNVLLNANVAFNFPNPNQIAVFGGTTSSNTVPTTYRSNFRLYSLIIKDRNNVIKRDYIPVYRKSDNERGLYDLVNDVFYPNQGTGTFEIGSEL